MGRRTAHCSSFAQLASGDSSQLGKHWPLFDTKGMAGVRQTHVVLPLVLCVICGNQAGCGSQGSSPRKLLNGVVILPLASS